MTEMAGGPVIRPVIMDILKFVFCLSPAIEDSFLIPQAIMIPLKTYVITHDNIEQRISIL